MFLMFFDQKIRAVKKKTCPHNINDSVHNINDSVNNHDNYSSDGSNSDGSINEHHNDVDDHVVDDENDGGVTMYSLILKI